MRPYFNLAFLTLLTITPAYAQLTTSAKPPAPYFEILTHRMDVDVDGAPNAYGPPGVAALDVTKDAHYRARAHSEIVGYLTDDDNSKIPILQGPHDPFPGYYISQTAFTDPAHPKDRDVLKYIDATKINYVVLGSKAKHKGARLGDFVAVYSKRTHQSVFAIVGDDGNPSGNEGSLHLLQALGYPFHNGIDDAVEVPEIILRFFPTSNPHGLFFHSQAALNAAALKLGLSREFNQKQGVANKE